MVSNASSTYTVANSGSKNPITNDVKLNILVHEKLETITKYKQFQRWKTKFLDRFETYLTQSGMEPARAASRDLQVHLETCLTRASNVLDVMDRGDLSPLTQKRTVKASQALKEFGMSLEVCRSELEELVPAKQMDEKRKRYTKFHVGSSLIRDGFPQYVAMLELEECVHAISDRTYDMETDYDNLNKQERELFCQYKTQVRRFCDVMSDLDLYDIMLTCVEFLDPPENDDEDDSEELTIFVKRYQRYHPNQGGIKRTNSNGTDTTGSESGSDNEPSFRGDDDDSTPFVQAPPILTVKVDIEDCETFANVATLVAEDLGFHLKPLEAVDITHQITMRLGNDCVVKAPKTTTLRDLGVEQGDTLTLEQAHIPIKVRRIMPSGVKVDLNVMVDPLGPLRELKYAIEHQQHQRGDGIGSIRADDQRLFFRGAELDNDKKSCASYGIHAGSLLNLEEATKDVPLEAKLEGEEDRIVIVDTKYGTMFSVDRQAAIKKAVLTPQKVNTDDAFVEATKKDIDKDRMLKAMMSSPNLGVKPQIVIQKMEVEDYDIDKELAHDVKNMWGVELKKVGKNQRMSEIFFVDLKTKAVGFLTRQKLLESNFIKVVKANNVYRDNKQAEMTLEQAETDQQKYDFYVFEIRKIFGIAYQASLEESLGLRNHNRA